MMTTVVRMPEVLANATEAAISAWLAEPGQAITIGDPLAEIETDKAVVEYASEVAGTLAKLLVEAGRSVPVGAPIAVVLAPGEGPDQLGPALASLGVESGGADSVTQPTLAPAPPEPETAAETDSPPDGAAPEPAAASDAQPQADSVQTGGRAFVSPIVRRLARERGLDLAGMVGSGPAGRIVQRDLDTLPLAVPPQSAAPAAAATPQRTASYGAAVQGADAAAFTDVPLTGMRRAIARRLTESKSTVPHFYLTAHCRVDRLLELRRELNETGPRKVSVNDFVLKAVAGALIRVPAANAIWGGDHVRSFHHVDLAVAVAVEGGLLTPVLRRADTLTLAQIAGSVTDLAERARAGRLQQQEIEGGSFAVSNLGMYGVDEFSAILNPPQSGILAVSAAKRRAVVDDDGNLAVATVMAVTLSADHRVIDGAVAAEWMSAFVSLVEKPVGLLAGV